MPWLPEKHMPNYTSRGVVQPSGLHTGSGGMWLPLLLASHMTPRKPIHFSYPGLVITVPPQLALKATGVQEWDGMGCFSRRHRRGPWQPSCTRDSMRLWEDRLERCLLEICCPTWKTDTFQSHKNSPEGRFVTVLSFCFWIGVGQKKILFWQREQKV